jgi:hypothetical protein
MIAIVRPGLESPSDAIFDKPIQLGTSPKAMVGKYELVLDQRSLRWDDSLKDR